MNISKHNTYTPMGWRGPQLRNRLGLYNHNLPPWGGHLQRRPTNQPRNTQASQVKVEVDAMCERIQTHVPSSPYILSAPSEHEHRTPEEADAWRAGLGDLFAPDEEHLQYQSFLPRDQFGSLLLHEPTTNAVRPSPTDNTTGSTPSTNPPPPSGSKRAYTSAEHQTQLYSDTGKEWQEYKDTCNLIDSYRPAGDYREALQARRQNHGRRRSRSPSRNDDRCSSERISRDRYRTRSPQRSSRYETVPFSRTPLRDKSSNLTTSSSTGSNTFIKAAIQAGDVERLPNITAYRTIHVRDLEQLYQQRGLNTSYRNKDELVEMLYKDDLAQSYKGWSRDQLKSEGLRRKLPVPSKLNKHAILDILVNDDRNKISHDQTKSKTRAKIIKSTFLPGRNLQQKRSKDAENASQPPIQQPEKDAESVPNTHATNAGGNAISYRGRTSMPKKYTRGQLKAMSEVRFQKLAVESGLPENFAHLMWREELIIFLEHLRESGLPAAMKDWEISFTNRQPEGLHEIHRLKIQLSKLRKVSVETLKGHTKFDFLSQIRIAERERDIASKAGKAKTIRVRNDTPKKDASDDDFVVDDTAPATIFRKRSHDDCDGGDEGTNIAQKRPIKKARRSSEVKLAARTFIKM